MEEHYWWNFTPQFYFVRSINLRNFKIEFFKQKASKYDFGFVNVLAQLARM